MVHTVYKAGLEPTVPEEWYADWVRANTGQTDSRTAYPSSGSPRPPKRARDSAASASPTLSAIPRASVLALSSTDTSARKGHQPVSIRELFLISN